jgi:periplasmic protein TonB
MAEACRARRGCGLSGALGVLTDNFDTIEIVIADTAPVDDERPEPTLAAAPFFIEFDEPIRLDPDRVGLIWELPPAPRRAIWLRSPLVSLAVHLLPLLLVMFWPNWAAEIPPPIPVKLVFEEPPPPPPPPPQPAPQPPPPQQPPQGRLASVDMGDVKPKDMGSTTSQTPPSAGQSQPNPAETQTATTPKPVPPLPSPKPVPPKEREAAVHVEKPSGSPVPRHDETPHEAPRAAHFAGPAASRDEYLAYLVSLTRQHIDLLPLSVVGDRHGETVISLVIHDNGVIGPMSVLRSSGYPDIDQRVEQMVAAVHRAPPLPQWFQGEAMELVFTLKFPEALELK